MKDLKEDLIKDLNKDLYKDLNKVLLKNECSDSVLHISSVRPQQLAVRVSW